MNNSNFILILLFFSSFTYYASSITDLTPPSYEDWATLEEQLNEKEALLSIKSTFDNHPFLDSWVETSLNLTANATLPCSLRYSNIECQFGYVSALLLGGGSFSFLNSSWPYFKGEIPWNEVLKLKKIIFVDFSNHNLTGTVLPPQLSNNQLQNLQYLYLYSNRLSGTIPDSIGMLKNMTYLQLHGNSIFGNIPSQIENLKLIQVLTLYENKFNGTIPSEIGYLKKITNLDLSSNEFEGTIPESFSNLTSLSIFILQNNKLSGKIPMFLSNLTSLTAVDFSQNIFEDEFPSFFIKFDNLTDLSLEANSFYGAIPSNIWNAKLLTNLDLSSNYFNGSIPTLPKGRKVNSFKFSQNCFSFDSTQRTNDTCKNFYLKFDPVPPSPPPPDSTVLSGTVNKKSNKVNKLAIVLPIIFSFLLFLLLLFIFFYIHFFIPKSIFDPSTKQTIVALTKTQIQKATKNFTRVIGEGGYGIVYKGENLIHGCDVVAVKRLETMSKHADVEFRREIKHLSKLHHRHLVQLLGFCDRKGERMLVYEYMEKGSVYDHLHGKQTEFSPLDWGIRTKIALQVASALKYLHFGLEVPLIHRDIKSANILLGRDWIAKISDFGLCKEAPLGADKADSNANVASDTLVRGSFGYLDPEYVRTSKLTDKSDVYSFGVVLLELITGHEAIHEFQPLANWAHESMSTREKALLAVDKKLGSDYDVEEIYALVDVALNCTQETSDLRPSMRDVAQALTEIAEMNAKSPSHADNRTSETYSSESFKKEGSRPSLSGSFQWTPQTQSHDRSQPSESSESHV